MSLMNLNKLVKKRSLEDILSSALLFSLASIAGFPGCQTVIPIATQTITEPIERLQQPARKIKTIEQINYNQSYEVDTSNKYCYEKIFGINWPAHYLRNIMGFDNMCKELKQAPIILLTDVHFIRQQKLRYIDIIDKLDKENLAVGLEILYANQQQDINDYINKKINIDDFIEKHWLAGVSQFFSYFNYANVFEYLREQEIETFAISPAIDSRILDFIKNMKKQGIEPPYEADEKGFYKADEEEFFKIKEIAKKSQTNYWEKDCLATQLSDEYIKKGKQVVLIMGALHATQEHLPEMIFNKTGIKPVVVYQDFADVSIQKGFYVLNKSGYNCLKKQGLDEQHVLKIKNHFFMNTEWNYLDYFIYIANTPDF